MTGEHVVEFQDMWHVTVKSRWHITVTERCRLVRTVAVVSLRDIGVGEELFSTYFTVDTQWHSHRHHRHHHRHHHPQRSSLYSCAVLRLTHLNTEQRYFFVNFKPQSRWRASTVLIVDDWPFNGRPHQHRRATDTYTRIRWLVHWPLMGGLLHLAQYSEEGHGRAAGCRPVPSLYQM